MVRTLLTAVLALLLSTTAAVAQDHVLLHNGNVVTGRAESQAGRIRVVGEGVEYWFNQSEVLAVAPSRAALHDLRRRELESPGAVDHLRLAVWCIENELYAQASRELLDARRLDPADARIAVIERQLMQAAYPVQQAAATQDLPQRPRPALTDADLARMPEGAVEEFTRRIQPLLVNNCTTSGCHGDDATNGFHLDRSLLYGTADYRSTRANLAAVLGAIDRADPVASPLLQAANEPHAGRQLAAFTGRRAPLGKRLEEWVIAIAAAPRAEPNTALRSAASGMFGLVKRQRERDQFIQSVAARGGDTTQDEFDPAVFNRRHR